MLEIPFDPIEYKELHNSLNKKVAIDLDLKSDANANTPGKDGDIAAANNATAYVDYPDTGGGTGYTSPLIETTQPRTYFPDRLYVSTDGLLCMIVKPLENIYFVDSSNPPQEVQFILREPPTPT